MIRSIADATATAHEWLLLGDPGHQYPLAVKAGLPALVLPLPDLDRAPDTRHSCVYLQTDDTCTTTALTVHALDDAQLHHLDQPTPAWDPAGYRIPLADALTTTNPDGTLDTTLRTAAPLAVLRLRPDRDQVHIDILTCARLRSIGALFVRTAELTTLATQSLPGVIGQVLDRCRDLNSHVAGEWMPYTTHEAGTELEIKFTLTGHRTPWELARHFAARAAAGNLEGFIPDIGNELQRWHFRQHTFEITAPPEARGYLAFMPDPDGTYLIKRKTFQHDALRRHEDFRNRVPISDGHLADYVATQYPDLTTRALHDFNRTRFDVNLESTLTGDCFGIEIDEVVLPDTGAILRQAEIEYHRTRTHLGISADTLEPELHRLADIVGAQLAELGESSEPTYYSKLTFLRQQF